MRIIQGFVANSQFTNNNGREIADFFELSPVAMTYSRERGEYQSSVLPSYVFHSFASTDSDTGISSPITPAELQLIFSVTQSTVDYFRNNPLSWTSEAFVAQILNAFSGQLTDFSHGEPYLGDNDTFPEWLDWTDSNGSKYHVWLNCVAFENQYSYYEHIVVPPFDTLDNFFGNYGENKAILSTITPIKMLDKAQVAKGRFATTVTRILEFKYYNPNNRSQYTPTYWAVLDYGLNGDNIDSLKDSIAAYLLANSTHTEEEWMVIFPEIFERTEFLFFPRWDKIAIQNTSTLSVLYASIGAVDDLISYVTRNNPAEWDEATVRAKLSVIPFTYKNVIAGVLAGQTNGVAIDRLEKVFPDYLAISTSSPDFLRMTAKTREWLLAMVEIVKIAESATIYSTVINPYRRTRRNGQLFVSYVYEGINYLVSAKSNGLI